jgi:hypothetical protein
MDNPKAKFMDPTRILTVANMISLLRAFMAIPLFIFCKMKIGISVCAHHAGDII